VIVLDVHLDLFVPRIHEIAANALDELFVIDWRKRGHWQVLV